MTMVSSGPISLGGTATSGGLNQSVNVELGRSGTASINMNEAAVRTLAGVPSGAITMNNFYGKSNRVAISRTFTANTANASQNLSAIAGYVAGKSDITITINSGIYLYSTSTGTPGLNLTGGTTGDTVTLVNNGFIMGMGGTGGGYQSGAATFGTSGGTALNIGTGINITINNTNGSAYIGGGGGGGSNSNAYSSGGGGAGGGAGGYTGFNSPFATGGVGGSIGSTGGNGVSTSTGRSGGGGGRIFPGSGGASVSQSAVGLGGGAGGSGGSYAQKAGFTVTSGAGGSTNGVGGNGVCSGGFGNSGSGGGGGWGANGGTGAIVSSTVSNFGLGGKAVALNGKTVTWVSGNTSRVYGAVS
jgi:hypothetical protein